MIARFPEQPVVLWCDLMKRGRMTGAEVDEMSDLLATILKKRSTKSVAIVVAPYLVSEKIGSYRTQLRHFIVQTPMVPWTNLL